MKYSSSLLMVKGYSAMFIFLGLPGICQFTLLNFYIIPDWFPWCFPGGKTTPRYHPAKFLQILFITCGSNGLQRGTEKGVYLHHLYYLFNSIHNKHLFKLLTLSKIDDDDNTINNYNIDSAVKQKHSMKSITYHQPHIEFFGLKDVGLISRKKKNEKALYKRKVCQCFFLN